jgi:hypothetical protein
MEFHTYKLKEKKLQSSVKICTTHSINPEEIKTETEKLGYIVTNIWNVK